MSGLNDFYKTDNTGTNFKIATIIKNEDGNDVHIIRSFIDYNNYDFLNMGTLTNLNDQTNKLDIEGEYNIFFKFIINNTNDNYINVRYIFEDYNGKHIITNNKQITNFKISDSNHSGYFLCSFKHVNNIGCKYISVILTSSLSSGNIMVYGRGSSVV